MKTLSGIFAVLAVIVLVVAVGGALVLDKFFSTKVLIINPKDPAVVKLNKSMWAKGDPVAEIYGIPTSKPLRVVFVDKSKLVKPSEDPSMTLLAVDKQKGENPLQIKTVWFFARYTAAASGAAALLFFALFFFLRRRQQAS